MPSAVLNTLHVYLICSLKQLDGVTLFIIPTLWRWKLRPTKVEEFAQGGTVTKYWLGFGARHLPPEPSKLITRHGYDPEN